LENLRDNLRTWLDDFWDDGDDFNLGRLDDFWLDGRNGDFDLDRLSNNNIARQLNEELDLAVAAQRGSIGHLEFAIVGDLELVVVVVAVEDFDLLGLGDGSLLTDLAAGAVKLGEGLHGGDSLDGGLLASEFKADLDL